MVLGLPNLLTYSRILVIPGIVAGFYLNYPYSNWVTFGLFVYAGLTDYLDGWLARAWDMKSKLGQLLDPIADKLLVTSTMVMLVSVGTISGTALIAALIILLRELLVSGLREFLAHIGVELPVSKLAKWKTATQILAVSMLLLGEAISVVPALLIGIATLWISAGLTIVTGYFYLRSTIHAMRSTPDDGA